ncbi:hypothetical protein [Bosea sp. ANAM02]|uniref:hypothetical protein n=1 Tax=Bosea sp. ANAM02 TaxID=2020412 RepID=UPI000645F910|nr:hypothetical protein [Bosea sp. ANAM02]BCB21169.1 hypothetical protein OCUBac02_40630 [Bosea sp. ANAM02]
MFCEFRSAVDPEVKGADAAKVCRHFYREDVETLAFIKATTAPGATTSATFGAALVGSTVGEFLASLAPASAAAALITAGISVDLQTYQQLALPVRMTSHTARP